MHMCDARRDADCECAACRPDSEGEQLQFMAFGGVCARREGQKREGRGRREGRQKGDGRGTSQEGGNVCVWRGWLLALGG